MTPTVVFPEPGDYTLRLTMYDDSGVSSSDVTIRVVLDSPQDFNDSQSDVAALPTPPPVLPTLPGPDAVSVSTANADNVDVVPTDPLSPEQATLDGTETTESIALSSLPPSSTAEFPSVDSVISLLTEEGNAPELESSDFGGSSLSGTLEALDDANPTYLPSPIDVSQQATAEDASAPVPAASSAAGDTTGSNSPPSVNSGIDQTITLPSPATLSGSVSDDGLPNPDGGSHLTIAWAKVAGAGDVSFADSSSPTTTASFAASGQYVLRLWASDGEIATSDDVTIEVRPEPQENQPPVVDAGPDQTITLPNAASLQAVVSDDGLPTTDSLTIEWAQISGPGTASFDLSSSPVTNATFSVDGTYVLRLWASDSVSGSSDDVILTVRPAPTPDSEGDSDAEAPTGRTVYVAKTGNDGNAGTEASPYVTFRKALESVGAGDTVMVRGGTYTENIRSSDIDIPSGTSFDDPVVFQGYPGEHVIIRPAGDNPIVLSGSTQTIQYVIFRDLTIDAVDAPDRHGVLLSGEGVHHIRFERVEVMNVFGASGFDTGNGSEFNEFIDCDVHDVRFSSASNQHHGIYITTSNNLIEGGTYHDNLYGYGIHLYNPGGVHNNVVRNTRIYDNSEGMVIGSGTGNLAYNNLIYDNPLSGIMVGYRDEGTRIYNNTIYGTTEGYALTVTTSGSGVEIRNNILWGNSSNDIHDLGTGTVAESNLTSDPLFVNPDAGDFRLRSGSAAIDVGTSLPDVPVDFDGTARPTGAGFDAGAYEYK